MTVHRYQTPDGRKEIITNTQKNIFTKEKKLTKQIKSINTLRI